MNHTPRLNLPLLYSGQSMKEITHNEALLILDALVDPLVQAIGVNNPEDIKEEIQEGGLYIIGKKPEKEFADHPNEIAQKISKSLNGWRFLKPSLWMEVTHSQDGSKYCFNGNKWQKSKGKNQQIIEEKIEQNIPQKPSEILLEKEGGEYLKILHFREEFALNGSHTNTTIKIPKFSIVIAVNVRVMTALTGCSSFSVGVADEVTRYGSNLSPNKDTTNIGLTNHMQTYWQDTSIRITANGNNFTGGTLLVTIQCFKPHGAWDWE